MKLTALFLLILVFVAGLVGAQRSCLGHNKPNEDVLSSIRAFSQNHTISKNRLEVSKVSCPDIALSNYIILTSN
ncbi:uncharacterized protein LOC124366574 isoform X1 [Homalodisca vitripennis]|uniref:uncharacterized protein LOC124366574 isoform X1 n=1 Tax=Homalodisca vitripennis TaxID=197043 RepID=UPI001EECCF32|nr:uncharacterized protein LOC124366574 isoform X1 [Homalodisca vitripennis]